MWKATRHAIISDTVKSEAGASAAQNGARREGKLKNNIPIRSTNEEPRKFTPLDTEVIISLEAPEPRINNPKVPEVNN